MAIGSNIRQLTMWMIKRFIYVNIGLSIVIATSYFTLITLGGLLIGVDISWAIAFLIALLIGILCINVARYLYQKYTWIFIVWICIAVLAALLLLDMTRVLANVNVDALRFVLSGFAFGILFRGGIKMIMYVLDIEEGISSDVVHSQNWERLVICAVSILSGIILSQAFYSLLGFVSASMIITVYLLTAKRI